MLVKECAAFVKAVGDDTSAGTDPVGTFEAIVSVFGNKDSAGDVVMPDAFDEDLAAWRASGDPIPVIWSHDWSDPFSHIGATMEAKALQPGDDLLPNDIKGLGGLYLKGVLDIEDNPTAAQVYKLMRARRVKQFSFAYDVLDAGVGTRSGDDVYELRKLKIFEAGPTLLGANQETELLAVKAHAIEHGVKEGRVLAQKHVDSLREAHNTLGNVITAVEKAQDDAKAAPAEPVVKVFLGDEEITDQVTVTKNDPQISAPTEDAEHEEKNGQPPAEANDPGPRAGESSACEKRLSPALLNASIDADLMSVDV